MGESILVHKPLRILTCVWGEKHTELFLRGCVRTLSWPRNKAAMDGATWEIVTKSDDAPKIRHMVEETFPNIKFEIKVVPPTIKMMVGDVDTAKVDHSVLILLYLQGAVKAAIDSGSRFLLAPPDTLFSEGSIPNLIKIGSQAGTVVAVPHPRVLPGIVDQLGDEPVEAQDMVEAAFENYLHESWVRAEIGHQQQSSLVGGVAWRKLSGPLEPFLAAVQHRLPTVYLANFLPEDYAYFLNQPSFGCYDHGWPGERHIRQERWRSVGSSDAVFICEVTDKDAVNNIPPWTPEHQKVMEHTPDAFYRDQLHNCTERLFVHVFRGV